jgi:hypothetical protein
MVGAVVSQMQERIEQLERQISSLTDVVATVGKLHGLHVPQDPIAADELWGAMPGAFGTDKELEAFLCELRPDRERR